jgi:hypothetical protein
LRIRSSSGSTTTNSKAFKALVASSTENTIKERGCRQGDPISPYLFVLCAEILACKIREDVDIKGINIANTEFKVSQFADDTSLLLNGDKESYEKLFQILNEFEQFSSLKLNYEKNHKCMAW